MKVELFQNCSPKEVIVVFFDDSKKPLFKWKDPALQDYLKLPLESDFHGKTKETLLVYLPGHPLSRRLLLVGVGKLKDLHLQKLRGIAAHVATTLQAKKISKAAFFFPEIESKTMKANAIAEALFLGSQVVQLNYDEWKSRAKKNPKVKVDFDLIVAEARLKKLAEAGMERSRVISEGVNFGRRLIAMSPRQLNPTELAKAALEMVKKSPMKAKIKSQIWTEKELEKNGYGGILCVSQGSDTPPRFIQLEYRNAASSKKPIVLVGKGVTFDSGGLSLKPPQGQETMKYDMAGAGTVLSAFKIATDLKMKINLVCLIPSVENMPSGKAQRPGDVVTMASGLSVEVLNTDAEGRLILADALWHASTKYKSEAIVDVATLTGACALAVGDAAAGVFSNNPRLIADLQKAADESGEHIWPLPDFDDFYVELLTSEVADLRNIGKRREGGASTAALFLENFIENDQNWAHLDIAGCGWYDSPRDMVAVRGPSGVPIRLLVEYLQAHAG
jgi:leucyl aminopeptidase